MNIEIPNYFINFKTEIIDEFKKLRIEMYERFDGVETKSVSHFKTLDDQMTTANVRLCEVLDRLDGQEEQIAEVSEQIEGVDKRVIKIENDMSHMKGDMAVLLDSTSDMEEKTQEIGGTLLSVKDDMRRLKANSSIWVVRDEGDDSYKSTPSK